MAAWQQLAWHALRPDARRPQTWRRRLVFASLFAATGAWAAAAPQAALGLGDRLRFAFYAISALCGFLAATAGLRHQTEALDDDLLNLSARKRFCARFSANFSKAAQDLLPAVPFLLFALALQAISLSELLQAVVISAGLLVASVAIQDFRALLGAILIGSVFFFSRRHNFFETILATLFGLHLAAKALIAWASISTSHSARSNLVQEATSLRTGPEIFGPRRHKLWRQFAVLVLGLAFVNMALIFMLVSGMALPATFEQKLALGFILSAGAIFLFIDSFALVCRGMLGGLTAENKRRTFANIITTTIGIPWAVAWGFSALHSGEVFTLNEGAAYFFLWALLGSTISWISGANAKEKLQREFRQILADHGGSGCVAAGFFSLSLVNSLIV